MRGPKWMFFVRELDAYPTGKRRVFLLFVVILANFVANYESQIAPVLSLILKDIGISNPEYGLIVSLSVVAAAFGALLGGPLSDRYGRTLILVQAFGYTPARAAFVSQFFWLFSLVTLIVSGYISDKLQLRKLMSLIGVIGMIVVMSIWIMTIHSPISESSMIFLISLMGGSLGFAYSPWMALYSENLEDIHGGIQASGWAVWSFVLRIYAIISAIPLNLIAVRYGWDTWLWITMMGAILYIPLLCMGKGPWFKRPLTKTVPTAIDS